MKTLNVIGAGRAGRTLASLWSARRTFAVQDVLDRSVAGAVAAVTFIGEGSAVDAVHAMRAADVWMITTPDRHIAPTCEGLAASGVLRPADVVFHCSGSLGSQELRAAAAIGASIASLHPLKTFADPASAVRTFEGTYCAAEGDAAALDVLTPAFEDIGARVSRIDPELKTIYHAASVVVCNYLTALLETGLRCYEKAGLPRDTALKMIEPIVRDTVQNVFELGPARALTGPIARGDESVVARQLDALAEWDPAVAHIYRDLGALAVDLAREQGGADADGLARIEALLKR